MIARFFFLFSVLTLFEQTLTIEQLVTLKQEREQLDVQVKQAEIAMLEAASERKRAGLPEPKPPSGSSGASGAYQQRKYTDVDVTNPKDVKQFGWWRLQQMQSTFLGGDVRAMKSLSKRRR